mmetsp:Transcript_28658/g.48125  ORF Transcript_28658/g.48125 Transcript_28658/m.48125 type:complete len:282 (-) Transcript_28658:1171-2016(-)
MVPVSFPMSAMLLKHLWRLQNTQTGGVNPKCSKAPTVPTRACMLTTSTTNSRSSKHRPSLLFVLGRKILSVYEGSRPYRCCSLLMISLAKLSCSSGADVLPVCILILHFVCSSFLRPLLHELAHFSDHGMFSSSINTAGVTNSLSASALTAEPGLTPKSQLGSSENGLLRPWKEDLFSLGGFMVGSLCLLAFGLGTAGGAAILMNGLDLTGPLLCCDGVLANGSGDDSGSGAFKRTLVNGFDENFLVCFVSGLILGLCFISLSQNFGKGSLAALFGCSSAF